jgi:hypothetical protein
MSEKARAFFDSLEGVPDQTRAAAAVHAANDLANVPIVTKEAEPQEAGRKWGEGHAMAMLRLGAHELTQALAAFPDSNMRPIEEPGIFGNPTQQIVTKEMGLGEALKNYQLPEVQQERGNDGLEI